MSAVSRSLPQLIQLLGHVDAVHGTYYLLLWPVTRVLGTGEFVTRLPSALAMTGAALGVAATARRLRSRRAALCAGLVFAALPAVSIQGHDARPYAMVTAAAVLASLAFVRAVDGPRPRRFAAYSLSLALLGYLHLFALLVVFAHAVTLFGPRGRGNPGDCPTSYPRGPVEGPVHRLRPADRPAPVDGPGIPVVRGWFAAVTAACIAVTPLVALGWVQRAQVAWISRPGWHAAGGLVASLTAGSAASAVLIGLLAILGGTRGDPPAAGWRVSLGAGARLLAQSYPRYGTRLAGLVGPSPRLAVFGLTRLAASYYRNGVIYQTIGHRHIPISEATPMFGLVLTTLAVLGLMLSWRRRSAWLLALLWLGAAALALGPALLIGDHRYAPAARMLHGVRVSSLMPYTWFVQIPGLSGFREAGRLAELGMIPAALLAGAAVDWLRRRAAPALIVVLAAGVLEAGWSGSLPASVLPAAYRVGTMPTAMPALDRPIAGDHAGSIVVDFPFGICGGVPAYGAEFSPEAEVLATADGHPRAVGFFARVPGSTITGIVRHPFYARLVDIWRGAAWKSPENIAAARLDARRMNVGWVLVWPQEHTAHGKQVRYWNQAVIDYLNKTGFRFAYQADDVLVYRATSPGTAPAGALLYHATSPGTAPTGPPLTRHVSRHRAGRRPPSTTPPFPNRVGGRVRSDGVRRPSGWCGAVPQAA